MLRVRFAKDIFKNVPWKKVKNIAMLSSLFLVIVLAIYLRSSTLRIQVLTGSMSPTICPLDILYATKGNDIEFGDVVVFYSEEVGEMLVKRVLGMGGDRIEIKEGVLYRNGYEVEEDYVEYQDYGSYVFDIPEDSYLVLGDNRLASFDSRYWDNPYVSLDAVEGKAIMITYPYTRWSVL